MFSGFGYYGWQTSCIWAIFSMPLCAISNYLECSQFVDLQITHTPSVAWLVAWLPFLLSLIRVFFHVAFNHRSDKTARRFVHLPALACASKSAIQFATSAKWHPLINILVLKARGRTADEHLICIYIWILATLETLVDEWQGGVKKMMRAHDWVF